MNKVVENLISSNAKFKRSEVEAIDAFLNNEELTVSGVTFEVISDNGDASLFAKHINTGIMLSTTSTDGIKTVYTSIYEGHVNGDIKMPASIEFSDGNYYLTKDSEQHSAYLITDHKDAEAMGEVLSLEIIQSVIKEHPEIAAEENVVDLFKLYINKISLNEDKNEQLLEILTKELNSFK